MGFGSAASWCRHRRQPAEPRPRLHARREAPQRGGGGKRPFHTIIPAFLTKDGKPQMSFGVMGGNMQPQGHLQTLVRMLVHRQQPQAACDAPRWKVATGLSVDFESTMRPSSSTASRRSATAPKPRPIRTWTTAAASSSGS
jgi:gamma-glutamyltranspeptidase